MSLKLYFDFMSPPSRILYILLKTSKCNFEPKIIKLTKGQHLTPEYESKNRFKKIPAIEHNDFMLTESVAILKYLLKENLISKTLYPEDTKGQARVDEYLEWQHIGLRLPAVQYFRSMYIKPLFTGKNPEPKEAESHKQKMMGALEVFDKLWLGHNQFVTGENINVADLFAAVDLEQPKLCGFDPAAEFPNIAKWWPKVREHFNPCYDEAHTIIKKDMKINDKPE